MAMPAVETCEACRFDGAQYDLPDTLGTLRALGQMWRWAVEGVDPSVLAARPEPSVWSAVEYAVHSAEVTEIHGLGLEVLLGGEDLVLDEGGVELGDPDTGAGMAASLDRLHGRAPRGGRPRRRGARRRPALGAHDLHRPSRRMTPPGSSATPCTT